MEQSTKDQTLLFFVMPIFSLFFGVTAFLVERPFSLAGWLRILEGTNAFVTDGAALGGLSGALFNSCLMGIFAWGALLFARTKPTGRVLGAFFACMGAGMFGATPLTTLPIVLGGFLYARLRRESFSRVCPYVLQSCALSPAVAALYFYTGQPSLFGVVLGLLAGVVTGMCALPLALHTRVLHQGFNLYSAGIPLGVMGILLFSVYREAVLAPQGKAVGYISPMVVSPGTPWIFFGLFGFLFIAAILSGVLLRQKDAQPYLSLCASSGLETDFLLLFGAGNTLCNLGLTGLLLLGYFAIAGISFNGAAAGALLYGLCWTGAGVHPRNALPILLGYLFTSLLLHTPLNATELVIGVCFALGLAPISGVFGGLYGILSGALHAFLMPAVLGLNGGFNLYTGAFASGVIALFMFPLLHEISRRGSRSALSSGRSEITSELIQEASALVDGMDAALSPVEPKAADGRRVPGERYLLLRNIMVCTAAVLFCLSLFPRGPLAGYGNLLRFIAYILGALAYGAEIMLLTDGFRARKPPREMLMPYIFGVLYLILGFSYLLEH